jgi:dUTP pyrophosphatase
VDLTLKRIKAWTSPGSVDFDNSLRLNASTLEVSFRSHHEHLQELAISKYPTMLERHARESHEESIMLEPGAYLIEFNEKVDVPSHLMGQMFVRSSLFRSGALLSAGVMDSGYQGLVGAMLQVLNPHGLLLFQNARLPQMVFHHTSEPVEGYSGHYQGSESV